MPSKHQLSAQRSSVREKSGRLEVTRASHRASSPTQETSNTPSNAASPATVQIDRRWGKNPCTDPHSFFCKRPNTKLPQCARQSHWPTVKPSRLNSVPPHRYTPDISIFTTITSWRGTVLPLVLHLPSFYILVGLHALFCYLDVIDTLDEEIKWSLFGAQPSAHSCAPILLRALCYPCHAPPHQACPPPFWSSSSSSTAPSATNDFLRCTHIVSASAAPPCSGWPWSSCTCLTRSTCIGTPFGTF